MQYLSKAIDRVFHLFRGNIFALCAIPVVLALMYLSWSNYRSLMAQGHGTALEPAQPEK